MLANPYVRLANNWLHDVATGLWAASLLVLVVLSGRLAGMPAEAAAAIGDTMQLMFWLLASSLAVIAVTGAIRLVYWREATPADELPSKRSAL
ncbi:MAG: hypothetical protein Q8K89_01650, partial [Actinomycetota bacterium]|nr:hypothetical protein [Actinomycetota bacterium]